MNFLVDAQLPPGLCIWLASKGHVADHVAALGLMAASDRRIADEAEGRGLILISKDEDFLLIRLPDRFAFLWLRVGNATNRALSAWLEHRWATIETMLSSGERLIEVR